MTPTQIAESAIALLNKRITNEIFLTIQNDRTLMHDYLMAAEKNGLDMVNQTIGKKVKKTYDLHNDEREDNPSCTLIQSNTTFK